MISGINQGVPPRRRWPFAGLVACGIGVGIVLVGCAIRTAGFYVLGSCATHCFARGWLRLKDRQPMPAP
jgi:hypothetical protein